MVSGAWSYEAGQASEIESHWCNFKTGIPSTNSVQPTQPVSTSKVRPRASRSSSQGRDVGQLTGHNAKGPRPGDWRAKALTCEVTISAERETARAPTRERLPAKECQVQRKCCSGIPSVRTQLVRFWPYLPMFWVFGSFHLPAVTSANEALTQTYRSSGLVQWQACWAQNPKVREEQSYMSACRIVRLCRTNRQPKERSRRSRFCTS